ncbi:MAG: hypothetical protein Q8Q09_27870 [Deltaproteobacteria bacterium]|nr:hypothetical protein [Deltaproteobacteria bacterium]
MTPTPFLKKPLRWGLTFSILALATVAGCSAEPEPMGGDGGGDSGLGNDVSSMDIVSPTDIVVAPDEGQDSGSSNDAAADGAADGAADVVVDAPPPRCAPGVDSDMDGIPNDEECRLGLDPFNPDSDMDGIPDGIEARYPRICVATMPSAQRRPPQRCNVDDECRTGERCNGLNPLSPDSDGDGVPDREEDTNFDGVIDPMRGESDPRLGDTDGDGTGDAMAGIAICRPSGLATVVQNGIPASPVQVGYAPTWTNAGRVTGTLMRGAIVLNDMTAGVAAVTMTMPSMGDVRTESTRLEAQMVAALGAGTTGVLVGRALTTHEMNPAITSTYRVARATTASALRDALIMPMVGAAAPVPAAAIGMSTQFYVDVTVVRRTMGTAANFNDVLIAVSPSASYDNPMLTTAIRSIDLVNSTATAQSDRGLGFKCQTFVAAAAPSVDFLWTVDTSGSMGPHQTRLGNTATAFFSRMAAAGIDFRVGVIQAGSAVAGPNLATFNWIAGSDAMGARRLCEEVTSAGLGRCPTSPTDTLSPFPFAGGQEEPTAAAILTHRAFTQLAPATNPRRIRAGAQFVTFHVTDEPGSNDFTRYFSANRDPQNMMPWGALYNSTSLNNIIDYFRRNSILTFGLLPVNANRCDIYSVADLPRCVVEGNRGAVIPIATATDPEIAAAMSRIVDAIAGASSQFRLTSTPITSTLKVRVRGMDVPRSRSEGFDYDSVSNAVVFYGARFRPARGNEVVLSYRVWQPCPSAGGMCVTDSECCQPHVCTGGRCLPPCTTLGAMCMRNEDCCSPNICTSGRCAPPTTCRPVGEMCMRNEDCCSPNSCTGGVCTPPPPCMPIAGMCRTNADCCDNNCVGGRCAPPPCRMVGDSCRSAADCCDRSCIGNVCAPG